MKQGGFTALFILIIVLILAAMGGLVLSDSHSPQSIQKPVSSTQAPSTSKNRIHLADNPDIPIENIKVLQVIFRPKDSLDVQNETWISTVKTWRIRELEFVAKFWEKILDNQTKIVVDFYPQVIAGVKKASEYDLDSIYQDISQSLKNDPNFQKYFNKQTEGYLILFTFVLIDGTNPPKFYNSNWGYHFDNIGLVMIGADVHLDQHYTEKKKIKILPSFDSTSAHELGHALGLLHSEDYPGIKAKYSEDNLWNSDCDLMYGFIGGLKNPKAYAANSEEGLYCLLPQQKELFFK